MRGRIIKRGKKGQERFVVILNLPRDPTTGKFKQKWVTCKTKKLAERKLTELLYQMDGGANLDPAKLPLGHYLNMWLRQVKTQIAARTYDRYAGVVQNHLIPTFGHLNVSALKPEHLQQHYLDLLDQGMKPSTVRMHHAVFHHALRDAPAGMVSPLIFNVKAPRAPKTEMQFWSANEMKRFLEATKGHPLFPLFYLALATGMRRSELLGLQWQDLDLAGGQLSVRRAFHILRDGTPVFGQPKSKRSQRTIALSPSTVAVLRAHQEAQGHPHGEAVVFSKGDKHWNPNTVTWQWKKACWAAGVRPIRLHDARHTQATLMLQQGVHPKIVQERLGHSSIQMTLDTYSHAVPGMQAAAALQFDRALVAES